MVCSCRFEVGVCVTLCEGRKEVSTAEDVIGTGIVSGVEHFDRWYAHWQCHFHVVVFEQCEEYVCTVEICWREKVSVFWGIPQWMVLVEISEPNHFTVCSLSILGLML